LKLRGPGEFFGTKQHGIPDLKIADLIKHMPILATVKDAARKLLEQDPALAQPDHAHLRAKIQGQFGLVL